MSNPYDKKYCISVSDLRKEYSSGKVALDGISFDVGYGKIFGFLGPNGAGKSTTIKILTTLQRPTSGTVRIFGKDASKHAIDIRRNIGVISQQPSYESHLTVERSMDLYGLLWGLEGERRKDKVNEIIKVFDLEEIRFTKNDELSIGQRRRVQVAREFLHDMDLLFLDEPTVGLDPSARRMLLDYIKSQAKSGLTVFFTTHIMEEAEYLCDEIAIINRGKMVAFGSPNALKMKYNSGSVIDLKIKDTRAPIAFPLIKEFSIGSKVEIDGRYGFKITSLNPQQILISIVEGLSKNNIPIESVTIVSPSLEEIFLDMVKTEKQ